MLTTISRMGGSVPTPPAPEVLPLRFIALVGGGQRGRHGGRGSLDGLLHGGALAVLQHQRVRRCQEAGGDAGGAARTRVGGGVSDVVLFELRLAG